MTTLIVGENHYGCKQRLGDVLDGTQNTTVDISELDNLDTLSDKLNGGSLFGEEVVVVVRYLDEVKGLQASFLKLIENLPETAELIIYLPGVKPSSALAKKLADVANANFVESRLSEIELVKWVVNEAKNRGATINTSAARELIEWSGESQTMLSNEIDKLVAFNKQISKPTIHEVATPAPSSTIFQMLDAMMQGDSGRAIKHLNDLKAQQYDSGYVMGMISWQANAMNVAMIARNSKTNTNVAKDSGISPFVLRKATNIIKKLSKTDLIGLNEYILDADYKLKNVLVDEEHLILNLINRVAFIQSS